MARGWSVLIVMGLACGRTDLDLPPLAALIHPADQTVTLGSTASFLGSASESEGPAFFNWRLFSRPGMAVARLDFSGATAELQPDQPGDWVVELRVSSEGEVSEPVAAVLHVQPPLKIDAGADAGTRDAGVDGGLRDAGIDAGVRDAGDFAPIDAGAIYLAGTLWEGFCGRDALADLFNPNAASVGFDCYFSQRDAMLRPSDGVMLYYNVFEWQLREYHCDVCSITSVPPIYPLNVLANDTVIPTPCPGTETLTGFLISVDGEILHRCIASQSLWRDSTGSVVHTDPSPNELLLSLGPSGWGVSASQLINWKTGSVTPIVGLPTSFTALASRWAGNGSFWMAIHQGMVDALWRIELSGAATLIGTYGALPPNTNAYGGWRLDRTGRLFQWAGDTSANFADIVVMQELGRTSTVVYTEATNPLVKFHASSLVTGP